MRLSATPVYKVWALNYSEYLLYVCNDKQVLWSQLLPLL